MAPPTFSHNLSGRRDNGGRRLSPTFRTRAVAILCVLILGCDSAKAQPSGPVKVGVLTDASSGYAALSGTGSLEAAKMAADDAGGSLLSKPIVIVFADHQNKADVGGAIAREWFDEQGVDAIADLINSSVALGVQSIAREKNKIALFSAATSSDLTGEACSPNGLQWGLDAYSLAHGLAEALIAGGGDTWFFVTSDYAAGQAVEREMRTVLDEHHVQALGGVRFPLNNPDFSSFLLQAQSSHAKIIAATSGGADTINLLKQAIEFSIPRNDQKLALASYFITDTQALGLQVAHGIQYTTAFYYGASEASRVWATSYFDKTGKMPTWNQAMTYSAVLHYLKAVKAAGTKETGAVIAEMRKMSVNDPMTANGVVRPDGRLMRDVYLVEVKTPAESSGPWDYEKLSAIIPADKAFRPLSESACPLIKGPQ
jgi:branched-chain amino acid transport system substrate-binding protein